MKNRKLSIILATVISLAFVINCYSQNTYNGSIFLDGQNKVDSFPINYPNISNIHGDLTIINVNTLDSLIDLVTISGTLDISGNLSNFNGLNSLNYVGQTIFFNTTASSISCNGLNSLTFCANFRPEGNGTNISFNGLNNPNLVINIMHMVGMNFNNFLGLSTTVQVDGLNLINCQFADFQGFENIDSMDVLAIQNGTTFNSYNGLNSIEHIGTFLINDANNPSDFTGLENLTSINEIEFYLYYLGNNSLNGLENIDHTKIDLLTIVNINTCSVQWLCDYFNNGNYGTVNGTGACLNVPVVLQNCNQYIYTGTGLWTNASNWTPTYPGINITNATITINGNVTIPNSTNVICNNCSIINNGNIIIYGNLIINN